MKLCGFDAGLAHPLFLIAGPCVVESEQLQMDVAGTLKEITSALGIPTLDGMGAVGEGAHARHESIVIEHLAPRTALLAGLLAMQTE